MKAVYLSKDQHQKLSKELHTLKYTERPKIIQDITDAREHGDLRENAEYAAAKEKQEIVERKISRLEEMLSRARILDESASDGKRVLVGKKVKLVDTKTEEIMEYELVPTTEFSTFDLEAVSVDSPVGKALLGKTIGEIVEIKVPAGTITYRVEEIF